MRTVLVIPCYNEAQRLPQARLLEYVDRAAEVGLLLVNDGSTDQTKDVLEDLARQRPGRISALHLAPNVGKAEAVRLGLAQALRGSQETWPAAVGYWDADLATPLEELPYFQQVLAERPQTWLVMGARIKLLGRRIERKLLRHYVGRFFATATALALGCEVYDTQCGAKLFRVRPELKDLLAQPMASRWLVDVELLFRLRQVLADAAAPGLEQAVYELPLSVWSEIAGSKVGMLDLFRSLWRLGRLRGHYGPARRRQRG